MRHPLPHPDLPPDPSATAASPAVMAAIAIAGVLAVLIDPAHAGPGPAAPPSAPPRAAFSEPSPAQNFWRDPDVPSLEAYARWLERRHLAQSPDLPLPLDPTLEAMKAQLEAKRLGPKPASLVDWSDLQRAADEGLRSSRTGRMSRQTQQATIATRHAVGLTDAPWSARVASPIQATAVFRVVQSIHLTDARPSLFRDASQLAMADSDAIALSGRFGIAHRHVFTARDRFPAQAGVYDLRAVTVALDRPIRTVRLQRDGRVLTEASRLEASRPMGSSSPTRCGDEAREAAVLTFHTTLDRFAPRSGIDLQTSTMNRAATGFAAGTRIRYDLDSDGIDDLVVWEGRDQSPGQSGRPSAAGGPVYRLVLANVAGAWKVLGHGPDAGSCQPQPRHAPSRSGIIPG